MNPNYAGGVSSPSPALGIVSLALGVGGILLLLPTLVIWLCGIAPFVLGIAAVICGLMSLSRIKRAPQQYGGKPLAIIGILLGVGAILAPTLYAVLNLGFMAYTLSR
jgi:hypothetical protein